MIFTLEGIDASGKATQTKKLVEKLKAIGPTVAMDFPHYQTRSGQAILGLLTGKWGIRSREQVAYHIDVGDMPPDKVSAYIETIRAQLRFEADPAMASRTKMYANDITDEDRAIKALVLQSLMTTNRLEAYELLAAHHRTQGSFLVNDRYYASGLVYGEADGLPLDYLVDIHRGLPPSDLWIFIDILPEESRARRPERRDEYERRAGFMEKVREGYLRLFQNPPLGGQWVVVDGMGTAEEVHDRIVAAVRPFVGGAL